MLFRSFAFTRLREQNLLFMRQILLFTHCSVTVHALFITIHTLKNIKNGSHDTIHTFKNYFATVFLVFSFQFSVSATISSIQTDLKCNLNISYILYYIQVEA